MDMYTGILKIADFGGSKRLSGLLEKARTFAGKLILFLTANWAFKIIMDNSYL